MPFTPSPYQQDIFDWIRDGRGDAVVNAVAGSGKTTTLIEAAKLVHGSVLFVAFNKSIVETLEQKLVGSGAACKTINGVGHGAIMKQLGRVTVDADKYRKIARAYVDGALVPMPSDWDNKKYVKMLCELTSFAMSGLINVDDPAAIDAMVERQGIEVPDHPRFVVAAYDLLRAVLRQGEAMARDQKIISFDDQIFLAVKWLLQPTTADFVFVDEAQDLSKAKFELIRRCRSRGGRMLFVGDPYQAIYGFAGADSDAFANIARELNAQEFPLSVCYRCPTSVINEAKRIVPHLEAAPNAPEGHVRYVNSFEMERDIQEGDMILCRMTAPLVKTCLRLIAKHIPARVKGRDIGRQLTSFIRDAVKRERCADINVFDETLEAYTNRLRAKYAGKDDCEKQLEALQDKADSVYICWENTAADSIDDLCTDIEELFSDQRASVTLSTGHRAKGLENPRVYVIEPDRMPLMWKGQQEWEAAQELNVQYVILTRAQMELVYVDSAQGGAR